MAKGGVRRGRRMGDMSKTWVMAGGRQARVCAWRVISFKVLLSQGRHGVGFHHVGWWDI